MIRAVAALALLGLPLLSVASPQEEMTVEKLIDRMETAAAATRGVAYSLPSVDRLLQAVDVEADRAGRVRLTFPILGSLTSHPQYPDRQLILADRCIFFRNEWEFDAYSKLGFIPHWAEKLEAAGCDRLDPTFFPTRDWPAGMGNSEHALGIFFFLFSPREALAFERHFRVLGKRVLDGEECWVLRGEKALAPPCAGQTKKFFIRARDYKLHSIRMTASFSKGHAGESSWTVRYGPDSAPVRIHLKHQEGTSRTSGRRWDTAWDLASARRPGAPDPITVPDDLYAAHFRLGDVRERLRATPENPELLAALALATGRAEDWEAAVEKKPGIAPVVNLLRRYERDADPKLLALAKGIQAERKNAAEGVLIEAARAVNGQGQFDLALSLLDGLTSDAARSQRARALAGKREDEKAADELIQMIVRDLRPLIPYAHLPLDPKRHLDDAGLRRFLEAAKAHPASANLKLAIFREALRLRRFQDAAAAAEGFLALKPVDSQVQAFSTALLNLFTFQETRVEGPELEVLKDGARVLLARLSPTHAESTVRHVRFLMFQRLGELKGIEDEALKLMDALEKGDLSKRGLALELIKDFPPGPLLDRAQRLSFESYKSPAPLPPSNRPIPIFEHPLFKYCQARLKDVDYPGLLQTIRGIPLERPLGQYGQTVYTFLQARPAQLAELGKQALSLANVEDPKSAVDLLIWTGGLLETVSRQVPRQSHLPETKQIYDKVRKLAPDSWPALEGLIRVAIHDRDSASAESLTGEALARTKPGKWSEARLRLLRVHAMWEAGRAAEARRELEKLDLSKHEFEPSEAWRAAELWENLAAPGTAADFVERLVEDGRRPFVRLAQLCEKAGRAERALRIIDRAVAEGFEEYFGDPDHLFMADAYARSGGVQTDPVNVRLSLIDGACGDLAIREWLARPRGEISKEDAALAREALGRLGHEAIDEREKAQKTLSDLGPKCAGAVKEGLESADAEVKRRSRVLLLGWVLAK